MSFSGFHQFQIRRYSRWILVLFVISWINLVVQAPVHAAMQQQMALSDHAAMMACHCPERLCDTVLNLENQSTEVVHFNFDTVPDFQIAYTSSILNPHQQNNHSLDIKYLISTLRQVDHLH